MGLGRGKNVKIGVKLIKLMEVIELIEVEGSWQVEEVDGLTEPVPLCGIDGLTRERPPFKDEPWSCSVLSF